MGRDIPDDFLAWLTSPAPAPTTGPLADAERAEAEAKAEANHCREMAASYRRQAAVLERHADRWDARAVEREGDAWDAFETASRLRWG